MTGTQPFQAQKGVFHGFIRLFGAHSLSRRQFRSYIFIVNIISCVSSNVNETKAEKRQESDK